MVSSSPHRKQNLKPWTHAREWIGTPYKYTLFFEGLVKVSLVLQSSKAVMKKVGVLHRPKDDFD